MDRVLLEAAYAIQTAKDSSQAWSRLLKTLSIFEISKVIYATRNDNAPADWHILSNLPGNWPRELSQDPAFSEPFVSYCCATFEMTKVGPEYLDVNDHFIDEHSRDYVRSVSSFDWTAGLGIPTLLKGSGRHGGFILGNSMPRYHFERTVMPLADDLRTLCLVTSIKLEARDTARAEASEPRPLSPRETQVIELLVQGLAPKQIASELGLKLPSVRLYLKNARGKLGVSSNQEAIVSALQERQNTQTP